MVTAFPLVRDFPAEMAGVVHARSAVRAWLAETSLIPESLYSELILAGTELFTEAVERGCSSTIVLRAWADDAAVVLEVEGGEPNGVAPPKVRPLWQGHVSDLRTSILEKVCDEVWRSAGEEGHRVRCRKRIGLDPLPG